MQKGHRLVTKAEIQILTHLSGSLYYYLHLSKRDPLFASELDHMMQIISGFGWKTEAQQRGKGKVVIVHSLVFNKHSLLVCFSA